MRRLLYHSMLLVSVACATLTAASCASSGGGGSTGDNSNGGASSDAKFGMVSDQGGLNDGSFNQLANEGMTRAKSDLGVTTSVIESKSSSDYQPALGQFVTQGFDGIVAIGYLMSDAVKAVATQAPDTRFVMVDYEFDPQLPNVQSLMFKEQEGGYLAGALAGMVEQDGRLKGLNAAKVVSSVGGQKIPPVDRYIAGFEAGVRAECPTCRVFHSYSQDFIAQDKCKEQALSQIAQGSDIIFQVAGQCGLGVLDAAKERGVWAIGVDADQSSRGPHVLTSALKRVDVAVFEAVRSIEEDAFTPGSRTFGLAEDGVGLGTIAAAAAGYEPRILKIVEDIKSGNITPPTSL